MEPLVQEETKEESYSVQKKEPIRRVYLWEMIRYSPMIFFKLESSSKRVKMILESDLSYFHYYLEEMYGLENIRHFSFSDCKKALEDVLKFKPPGDYHIRLAVDERKDTGEDRSGWYLTSAGKRDSYGSSWAVLARPGSDNKSWKITPTHEEDVYYISLTTNFGWLCSHRWYRSDLRNESSTWMMFHSGIDKTDRGIWKITRSKGSYYQIVYAHDDFRYSGNETGSKTGKD